jgi:hypothetical protein
MWLLLVVGSHRFHFKAIAAQDIFTSIFSQTSSDWVPVFEALKYISTIRKDIQKRTYFNSVRNNTDKIL